MVDVESSKAASNVGEEVKETERSTTSKLSVQSQVQKRIQDQKRRQELSKPPPSQHRAAANNSFALGQGSVGTVRKATSKVAPFDVFKKQEPADERLGEVGNVASAGGEAESGMPADAVAEHAADDVMKDTTDEGMGDAGPAVSNTLTADPSPLSGVNSTGTSSGDTGTSTFKQESEEGEHTIDFAADYHAWVQQAGTASSEEEYEALFAKDLEEMKQIRETETGERSVIWRRPEPDPGVSKM